MISIRAFHPDDEPHLIELANNERVTRYLRDHFPRPYTRRDALYWIEEGSGNELGQHFAVSLNGNCIGSVGVFWGRDEYRYGGEVGYWVGEPYWGRGYATRAVELLSEWLLANTSLLRFEARVIDRNLASMRVLEKCGFQREGIYRRAVCKRGVVHDEHVYSRLRDS